MFKIIILSIFTAVSFAETPSPTPACVKLCPTPTPKPRVKKGYIHRKPATNSTQKQNQANEQDQHQTQTVNVYPNYGQVRERVVEKTVSVREYYNNRLNFLLGWGPTRCCIDNRSNEGLIGGVGYDRRLSGPFWLGVEVFTNRSYFGKVGVEF